MSKKEKAILVVGDVNDAIVESFRRLKKDPNLPHQYILLTDHPSKKKETEKVRAFFDDVIEISEVSQKSLTHALFPYKDSIVAATCRSEKSIPFFQQVVPYIPYLKLPTSESLQWSTNKYLMRQRFEAYAPEITPHFMLVEDASEKTLKKIEKEVGYPLMIKPSGFAQSMFVTNVYHRDELERGLKKIFTKAKEPKKEYGNKDYFVLVEHLMEGTMYSIDAYVDDKGKTYFCPFVHIKTGKEVGFDDYFGYQQVTPVKINEKAQEEGKAAARKAVEALGLKNITAHIEMYRTEDGWKVIEVGPRIGGFRQDMYLRSYGFDHAKNDLLIRMGKKPEILYDKLGYTAMIKMYAKNEGAITSIKGLKKVRELESMVSLSLHKQVGDTVIFAKNGGKSVFNAQLFNKERSNLLADIRRLEQTVKIEVKK